MSRLMAMAFLNKSHLAASPIDYLIGKRIEFVISSFTDIENFYLHFTSQEVVDMLNHIESSLRSVCTSNPINPGVLKMDDLVVYIDPNTGNRFRAAVLSVDVSNDCCSLILIDYGRSLIDIPADTLFLYPNSLCDAPVAFQAALHGVSVSQSASDVFSIFGENEILKGSVEFADDSKLFVKIFLQGSDETVNDILIENGLALPDSNRSSGSSHCQNGFDDFHSRTASEVFTGSNKVVCEHYKKFGNCRYGNMCKFVHDEKDLVRTEVAASYIQIDTPARELPESTFDVVVMHCETPALFYLKDKNSSSVEQQQLEKFQSFYKTNSDLPNVIMRHEGLECYPAVGEMVAAFDSIANQWKRARVIKFHETQSCKESFELFAVDFGIVFKSGMNNLRKLLRPYLFEPYIFQAKIKVRPKNGDVFGWNPDAKPKLEELFGKCRSVMCSVEFNNDDLFIVNLFTRNPGCRVDKFLIDNGFAEACEIPEFAPGARIIPG